MAYQTADVAEYCQGQICHQMSSMVFHYIVTPHCSREGHGGGRLTDWTIKQYRIWSTTRLCSVNIFATRERCITIFQLRKQCLETSYGDACLFFFQSGSLMYTVTAKIYKIFSNVHIKCKQKRALSR